jgi:hypothetical protein
MTKHFPVYKVLSVSIHTLISITITYSTIISVMCFKTVNASGNSVKYNINAP